jgi:Recombinase zinc beta ribbon domain
VLDERGEDWSRRRSNSSEYILAGLLRCTMCNRRMVGGAAHRRLYRYRYYTCLGRQQYGRRHGCDTPRLGADRAELQAKQLVRDMFRNKPVVRAAIAEALAGFKASLPQVGGQLEAVRSDIAKAEAVIRRYQLAFEDGSMPAADCGARLQELGVRLRDLRQREADLKETSAAERYFEITDELLDRAMREIELTFDEGTPAQQTALMRKLVHEIPTDGRRTWPKYRVPTEKVRIVGTFVDPDIRFSNRSRWVAEPFVLNSREPGYPRDQALAAIREFIDARGERPTAGSWTSAAMSASERTIRRRFGSFTEGTRQASLDNKMIQSKLDHFAGSSSGSRFDRGACRWADGWSPSASFVPRACGAGDVGTARARTAATASSATRSASMAAAAVTPAPVGVASLLVGGAGIANVMFVCVLERRSEIGLRRALDATRSHVRIQFLVESLSLSALGPGAVFGEIVRGPGTGTAEDSRTGADQRRGVHQPGKVSGQQRPHRLGVEPTGEFLAGDEW